MGRRYLKYTIIQISETIRLIRRFGFVKYDLFFREESYILRLEEEKERIEELEGVSIPLFLNDSSNHHIIYASPELDIKRYQEDIFRILHHGSNIEPITNLIVCNNGKFETIKSLRE